eukprot:9863927-Karenia_brevis.AAC.1
MFPRFQHTDILRNPSVPNYRADFEGPPMGPRKPWLRNRTPSPEARAAPPVREDAFDFDTSPQHD